MGGAKVGELRLLDISISVGGVDGRDSWVDDESVDDELDCVDESLAVDEAGYIIGPEYDGRAVPYIVEGHYNWHSNK